MTLYRCAFCRCLLRAELGHHRDRCPKCETGRLDTIARLTPRMLAEAELPAVTEIPRSA